MIQLSNVSIIFGKNTPLQIQVFDSLNLAIQSGEFVTVIGGNGSGKSTLLNLLSGEITADCGSVVLDGINVTAWPNYKRAQLISKVFQDPLLGSYADLTIEENLSIAYSRGKTRTIKSALSNNLKHLFKEKLADIGIGLEDRLTDKMGLLSGGQRQAISLVMATLRPSKILLLDEHTAALDPKMERLILDLTKKLIIQHKLTALMITHCMSQALEFGSRTLFLHQGQLVRDLHGEARATLNPADLMMFF